MTGEKLIGIWMDQGGAVMAYTPGDGAVGTLRAEMAGHPPEILAEYESNTERDVPCLLQIRCGKDGGGKGPLIQWNVSATLSCNNTQTLFEIKDG